MQDILEQILTEVKDVKLHVGEQEKKIEEKFEQQSREINNIFKYIDERFEQQDKRIDEMFKEQKKYVDERFEQQSKEIAQELRDVVDYICKRDDEKINKIEKEVQREVKNNKVAHDSYNSKIYKIELSQSNLESKIYDLENNKKLVI